MLDKTADPLYNLKAVKNAAIAQSVERILGKDEVASSNLASSSKNRQASTEDCRFLLVTYSLFTLHYNLVADFWEVIGNSE